MSAPVWSLSVDLQAKTASFTTGMAGAAQAARASFGDISESAKSMSSDVADASDSVDYSMTEARHGVTMLGEEFGVHLPRGITTFIASLGPVGAAMEAAFPFLAIILGATLLIEHLAKVDEEAKKLAADQNKAFESAALHIEQATAKSLELKIRLAELTGGPVTELAAKLRIVHDTLASMELAPTLKSQFEDLTKNIHVGSKWNPLNWLNDSRAMAQGVKDEAQSAGNAIANAVTLQEKQAQATQALFVAQGTLAAMQKTGNQEAIEDQKTLIRLLEDTKRQADLAVGNQKTGNKVEDTERSQKAAADAQKDLQQRHATLDQRLSVEEAYYKKSLELKKKAAEDEKKADDLQREAGEAFTHAVLEQDEQRAKLAEQMGKEEADAVRKMAELKLQAAEVQIKNEEKLHKGSDQLLVDQEIAAQNESYNAQMKAYQLELGALDKYGKDYEVKLKSIQDKEKELTQEHENKLTQIVTTAEEQRKQKVLQSENQMDQAFASTAAKSIIEGKNMEQSFERLGGQMMQTMLTNLMQMETVQGRKRFGDARTAAADAFQSAGNPILGAVEAAAAFTAVMAFDKGGVVPGVERGDVVPAMLTPGEGIIPGSVMDGLSKAVKNGGFNGGDTHIHKSTHNHYWSAVDGPSVKRMLEKHSDAFEQHVERHFRKRNM
jgi:hypothetical protein